MKGEEEGGGCICRACGGGGGPRCGTTILCLQDIKCRC